MGLPPLELAPQVQRMMEERRNATGIHSNKSHERRLEIHVVGCSREQAAGPVISFGPQDLEGLELPHDGALIIKVIIANSCVARVFVDTGSSVNVLFRSTFEEMQIDASELQPVATSLYGFTSNEVRSMGQIKLVISLGSEPLVRARRGTFLVVDSPSSYNVILGRPALHEFRMVISTFHQKIKFPVGDQVGEVRGEQRVSRRCYIDMVKVEARKAQRTHDGAVHTIQEEHIPWEEVQLYPERPESLTRVASDLPPELKEELVQCLTHNRDVFAWSTEELPGVRPEVAEHNLHLLPDARPVKQKKRNFLADQNKVIRAEVNQIRKAGHVHEVQFPSWLSNVVLVAKPNNKWKVCIDFRDLNKVSPKDYYPLLRIDQLVDSTASCERICMLDAYQGNAGATYQRMMDKIFRKQAGRNVECLFGAKGGKFLGYLVTERGIEVNPEKVRVLRDMKAPQNLKEAQKLVGRIIALSQFISRATDKAAPFFKVLRKASKFQWDEECTWAFEELKTYLETLPSLFKPVAGEPLWIYLSSTPEVMGAILVKEQDNVQRPVYFFSHLLKGDESRYTALEKLVYGLVLMARRLRPYFLAHPITVLANSTMGKALTNVEVAGRLIKWATELGEYNIVYQPRTVIKAQALADFLTEIHQPDSEETWKVYVDGSATRQGSGVGVLLISPQEDVLQLAVRLNFRATNNEAEYEALLAGLQAARHVGAARVIIYSDSQLVTQQVAGNFGINSDKLQIYQEAYEKMKQEFKEVNISKIPRSENGKADELAKMASSLTTWVLDRPIAQTFLIAQIDLQNNMNGVMDWWAPMISYLQQGTLPTELEQGQLIKKKVHAYTMVGDQLYK
ncbi:uncharacterized protein LOC121991361 [Zingiber officinale]|uniref:uncharacterized protein LOC121991361 n=1 Tax=Zingiber officinale TaxID=94328 RepID=UPI001C4CB6C1|nr:uncharacterized protein LOC121991361 [Zingiber officinale]